MIRKVLAVFAGLIAAFLIFTLFELINSKIYPIPTTVDQTDHFAMDDYARTLTPSPLIIVLLGWAVGSLICGLVIRLISRSSKKTPAYLAGLLLMTTGIVNVFMLYHPLWFKIIGVCLFIPLVLLGHWLYRGKSID